MCKQEFLDALRLRLSGLPKRDLEERLDFYSESIDDRVEEGCTEEDAVATLGSVEEIAAEILGEIPLFKLARERVRPKRRLYAWEIVLLVLGSPLWLSLLIAAFSVFLSLYAVLWSLTVTAWAVFASLVGGALGAVAAGILFICTGSGASGAVTVGAGVACAGLSILAFFGCLAATKGAAWLTKRIVPTIKKRLIKREDA